MLNTESVLRGHMNEIGSAGARAVGLAVIWMKAAVLDMISWMSSCVYRSMGGWLYAYMHAGLIECLHINTISNNGLLLLCPLSVSSETSMPNTAMVTTKSSLRQIPRLPRIRICILILHKHTSTRLQVPRQLHPAIGRRSLLDARTVCS